MRIFKFIKPYRGYFVIGMLFLFLTSITAMIFPMLMANLFGGTTQSSIANKGFKLFDLTSVDSIFLSLIIVFAAQSVFSFFRIYLFTIVTQNTLVDLRKASFEHLIKLPINFFNKNKVGELTSRITADITLIQETLQTTLAEFIRQFAVIIIGIVLLFYFSSKLALIMLATLPIAAIIAVILGRLIKKLSKQNREKIAESNAILEENLTGIANVKAFTNELFESMRYTKSIVKAKSFAVKNGLLRGAFISLIIFVMFTVVSFIIWKGATVVDDKKDLLAFVMYSVMVGTSFGSLPDLYAKIQKAIGATEHLMEILEEEAEPITIEKITNTKMLKGKVTFDNVSFQYSSRKEVTVLNNISFSINPGENIAIVGPSGAGKSTLASLLLRFYNPTSGSILFDDDSITKMDLKAVREQIAFVPQEVILFSGSIRENIAYGKIGASEEEIKIAAEKANAFEFIESFPDGMDTVVGDRGIQLSGGQKQRIAIARAILKDPSILILDEATSSLDSQSEKLVQDALEQLMKGRTSFIIAHRLSTIKNTNKILVLDQGQLVEHGSHDELIKKENGLYKNLSTMQFE